MNKALNKNNNISRGSKTNSSNIVAQREIRLQKVRNLRELGINPYPATSRKDILNVDLAQDFETYKDKKFYVTGRVFLIRRLGKIAFIDLRDETGKIQLFITQNKLGETDPSNEKLGFDNLHLLDRGDFVQAYGKLIKTKTGEISIDVEHLKILSKTLRPLPDKWKGLKDEEQMVRRSYLNMALNPDVRERFKRRSRFWHTIQNFLIEEGFVEINTPVLELVTGGADAKPFVTYYNALEQDFYLRISHELALKRLLGGGYEKVFDIGPRFRNEGFSPEHLPEHIAMEWYWAYGNYDEAIELTKKMFLAILDNVYNGKRKFNIRGLEVDFGKQNWEKVDYVELLNNHYGVDILHDSVEDLYKVLKSHGKQLDDGVINRNRVVDNLWKLIRKDIAGPIFLVGVPKFFSPLAKADPNNPEKSLRFHLVAGGTEMCNAFAELNNPVEQLDRFLEQQHMREQGDEEAHMLDIDFVEMLEYGMPPAVGFGLSERVFWLLEDVPAREGVPFPHFKYDIMEDTKKIYKNIWKYIKPKPSQLKSCVEGK